MNNQTEPTNATLPPMPAAEAELLAAVISSPSAINQAGEVQAYHFSSEIHREIWSEIAQQDEAGHGWDVVTLMSAFADGSPQKARILHVAANALGQPHNVPMYSRAVVEQWRNRREGDILAERSAGSITRDQAIQQLLELDIFDASSEHSITDALRDAMDDMHDAAEHKGGIRGISTGLADLDHHLGGWQRGELAIIGARPSMGKTAYLLHAAQHANVPLGMISAEMPAYQLAMRHVASIGSVSLMDLRAGKVGPREMEAVKRVHQRLKSYWILDKPNPTITDVMRTARRWHHQHGLQILYIDYIQRIEGEGDREHLRVANVVKNLKTLARDLDIPVVALSQVNRDVESRNNKRPLMADLSDSSYLEKEADQVITLYRDEVYNQNSEHAGKAEFAICKNRHGYTGTVYAAWIGESTKFADLSAHYDHDRN